MNDITRIEKIHKELFSEYDKWKPLFKDVRDFINPYIGYFEDETANNGLRCDDEMLRTMNIKYSQILAAGLQWGVTSPTRPWIKLAVKDDSLMQSSAVLQWLDSVTNITLDILARGGFYQEQHKAYLELGCFCTSAMLIEEDEESIIHCHSYTCGEYAIGVDYKGVPNQFARNIQMTAMQIIDKFGYDNAPKQIQREYDDDSATTVFHKVRHLICPNKDYKKGKEDIESMLFSDWYWIPGMCDKPIARGGYNEFPVMIERYQTKGADIYGTGPGIWSLGDAKQIQLMWRDMCTAVELGIKPSLQVASGALRNSGLNFLPGAVNFYDPASGQDNSIKSTFQVNLDLNSATAMQNAIEDCIKEHFNVSTFQLLSQYDGGARTATEIAALNAEKMSLLGPLLESLQTYLGRVFDRVFNIAIRIGAYPEPPEELQGQQLDLQFISVLAQAQKQTAVQPILSTLESVMQMAQVHQEVLDKWDFDETVDQLANLNGAPSKLVVPDEQVAMIRQQRAQQQQEIQQLQAAQQIADTAKTASQADMENSNALTKLVGQ